MSWVEGLDCRGGGGVLWAGSLGWWGLGQEMGEGTTRSPWAPKSVRSGRLRAGGWAPGWERPGLGGGSGRSGFLPSRRGPGRRPGAHLRPPRWAGVWPVTIGVPLPVSGAGSRRRPAGRAGGWAISTCTRTRGGARSAWRPPQGCCTRKAVGDATGTTTRGTGPWCARRSTWRPAGARTRQGETIHPAPDPRHPGTPPPSSPTTRRTTELALRAGRTRACWAGARAEAGGRHPQGTRGPIRWPTTTRSKTIRDTAPLQADPGTHDQRRPHPAPRAQDTRRGRPGAPSSKTNSPRHRLQSCPRHTRQPSMVYAIFPWEVICWQGDAIGTGLVECVSGLEVVGGGLQRVVRAGWKRGGRSSSASLSSYEPTTATSHRLGNIVSRGPGRAWQSRGRAFAGRRLVRPPSSRGRCRSSSCTLWCCPRA